ncbi:hypothetical protein FPQ18DRAFT_315135 [Pyronema domesticum]|nr:hypothetical protein FPQ18DRAFT_315135 [Pyronema domesticum]
MISQSNPIQPRLSKISFLILTLSTFQKLAEPCLVTLCTSIYGNTTGNIRFLRYRSHQGHNLLLPLVDTYGKLVPTGLGTLVCSLCYCNLPATE